MSVVSSHISTTKTIETLARKVKKAFIHRPLMTTEFKNKVLLSIADELRAQTQVIIKANNKDISFAKKNKLSPAMIDRLLLNEPRIESIANAVEEVAQLADPVGQVVREWDRPNDLHISKVRIPLGVVLMVYESRPNVTVDSAVLCFKSGNAVILRGGKEAYFSNKILSEILAKVLKKNGIPPELISFVPTTDRKALETLVKQVDSIDIAIPRGGESLMKFMVENSKVPVIKHDKGVCNLFVDESAQLDKAIEVIINSKVSRPGVCNALENLLIHKNIAATFLPRIFSELIKNNVEVRGDDASRKIIKSIKKATKKDWSTEYLDLILSIKICKDTHDAINFIREYGSNHTEAILSTNEENVRLFVSSLDSSCIVVNASTRFNDGGQLGLGAEIGISTTKLHAYGPMGLEELTSLKYLVVGEGQIRK